MEVNVTRAAILVLSVSLGLAGQGCVVSDDHGGRADDAAWARYQRDYDRWRVERAAWERRHERTRPRPREDWPRPQETYAPATYAASRSELAEVGVAEEADWSLPDPPPVKRGLELTWAPARQVVACDPCPPSYVRARRIVEYQPRPTVVCAPTYTTYRTTNLCAPTYRTTVCYPSAPVVRRQVVCAPAPVVCSPAPVYRGHASTGWSVSVGGGGGGVRVGWGAGFGRCR